MNVRMSGDAIETNAASSPQEAVTQADQTLWSAFTAAANPEQFVGSWLALLCRQIPGARAGVAVLGEAETGPFTPVAQWPRPDALTPELAAAADGAVAHRQPVLSDGRHVAVPVLVDGALFGTVALTIDPGQTPAPEALRRLQWGLGWVESLLRREQGVSDAALRERVGEALEVLAVLLTHRRFDAAAQALVGELSRRLDADPVALGLTRRKRSRVVTISGAASVGRRMNLMRAIADAMDEAVDQADLVLWPPGPGWDYRVSDQHQELCRAHRTGSALTVPLLADAEIYGALTFERPDGATFSDEDVALCDTVATLVGPVLHRVRRADRALPVKIAQTFGEHLRRLFGPRYLWRKLATLALIALTWAALTVEGDFSLPASARIEGEVQRSVVAPFDGYLATQSVRAGETVTEGALMATLDASDLELERLRWQTTIAQRETEFSRALVDRDRAETAIIRAQVDQAMAQLDLVEEQIARTRITAPFDGIVVAGDLSQSVGTVLRRGQELFRVAPLDSYRIVLDVEEADIAQIEPGQTGTLRLTARPETPLPLEIVAVTPVAEARDGRNVFRVEAEPRATPDWLRPAMEGAARIEIDRRLLADIWTRRMRDWWRMFAWRVGP